MSEEKIEAPSSALRPGSMFPNLNLKGSEGVSMELYDLRKKEHAAVLLVKDPWPALPGLISQFQDQAKLFEWLQLRLLPVYKDRAKAPTPWPAPGYPAWTLSNELPEGAEWGWLYLVSKNRTVFSIYPDPALVSPQTLERDMLYYEARHC